MRLIPPVDGIVSFEAEARTWRLNFGVNALCRLEVAVEDEAEVQRLVGGGDGVSPKLHTVRAAFWAGLQDHHAELTHEDAGNLMDRVGLVRAGSLVAQALIAAMPPADPDANPRKPTRKSAKG